MKYSTYVMAASLTFDLVADAVLLIVALALKEPRLTYDAYALTGLTIFMLIGMGASLGLTVGGHKTSMLVVSLLFNLVIGAYLLYAGLRLGLDVWSEAVGLLMVVVNVALTAIAYLNMDSGRSVPLPILGI